MICDMIGQFFSRLEFHQFDAWVETYILKARHGLRQAIQLKKKANVNFLLALKVFAFPFQCVPSRICLNGRVRNTYFLLDSSFHEMITSGGAFIFRPKMNRYLNKKNA